VSRFVKDEGQADSYAGLKINFVPGHNPDLILFDSNGMEQRRIDLTNYDLEGLHALMEELGFEEKD